jgi:tRNA-2-methylthio-N6-dimethylallyladenosine synthase
VGRTELALVEGISKKDSRVWACRTHSNKVVLIERDPTEDLLDQFVPVRITAAKTFYLSGQQAGAPLSTGPRRRLELPMVQ